MSKYNLIYWFKFRSDSESPWQRLSTAYFDKNETERELMRFKARFGNRWETKLVTATAIEEDI